MEEFTLEDSFGQQTTFVGKKHQCRVTEAGAECRMELTTSS